MREGRKRTENGQGSRRQVEVPPSARAHTHARTCMHSRIYLVLCINERSGREKEKVFRDAGAEDVNGLFSGLNS